MAEISYRTVMNVTLSWDKLKMVERFHDRAGELIFRRVFELAPRAFSLFNFTEEEDIKSNPQFYVHARAMVDMIDMAVGFIGPDLDLLAEDLIDLGRRHKNYGVDRDLLPVMENAVLYAMEELLGNKFTLEDRKSWKIIFQFMISHMVKGMK